MAEFSDQQIRDHFLGLKGAYGEQRRHLEQDWEQARAAYFGRDTLDKVYDGMADIQVPVIDWKVNGIVSRINRVVLGSIPVARFESQKGRDTTDKNVVDLWNKYVFEYQLGKIEFSSNFKQFIREKTLLGTAVAKITQEFEVREFSYFPGEERPAVVRDNTFLRPLLLEEFYSDISKPNIHDSEACIHSTTASLADLSSQTKVYKNLDLLQPVGANLTVEQEDYLSFLGVTKAQKAQFKRDMKETKKMGHVKIDECYGKLDLDGDGIAEEVLVTIANGAIIIRAEATPFRHKRYTRPFLVGWNIPTPNFLYGESKVIKSLNLLYELNASRTQASDAKTRSIAPMWWRNMSNGTINWDGKWTPNGVITGMGPAAIEPLLNPYTGSVSIQDSLLIQSDLDKLFNISSLQEGAPGQTPNTFRGTAAVISQGDMPLNDIIEQTSAEMKIFFEMLFERNFTFKSVEDLFEVWSDEEIRSAGLDSNTQMKELIFDAGVKILGNMELSNEIAQQSGYSRFLEWAVNTPPVVRRLDWKSVSQKMLKSFGIKDDADDIWLPESTVQEVAQAEAESGQQAEQQALFKELGMHAEKTAIDTEAKILEMGSEAQIEKATGQKIQ